MRSTETINWPENNTVTEIGTRAFERTALTELALPEGVEVVGEYAFFACNNLTSITMPSTLKTIGEGGFDSCSFNSVTLPAGLKTLGDGVFNNINMIAVHFLGSQPPALGTDPFFNCHELKHIYVPVGAVEAYQKAFGSHADLVKEWKCTCSTRCKEGSVDYSCPVCAGETADWDDICLGDVVPDGNAVWTFDPETKKLTNRDGVSLNAYIESGTGTNIIIAKNQDFSGDLDLTGGVNGKYRITEIAHNAFNNNQKITSIIIPEGVTVINNSFYNCTKLTSVTLPKTIVDMSWGDFSDCTSLKTVVCLAENPPTIKYFFPQNTTVYVPLESLERYRTADVWQKFADRIQPIDGTCTISVTPTQMDFGTVIKGQPVPAQQATVRNTGDYEVTVSLPYCENYVIEAVSGFSDGKATLARGAEAVFSVQPASDLAAGCYDANINVHGSYYSSGVVKAIYSVDSNWVVTSPVTYDRNTGSVSFQVSSADGYVPAGLVHNGTSLSNSLYSVKQDGNTATITLSGQWLNGLTQGQDAVVTVKMNGGNSVDCAIVIPKTYTITVGSDPEAGGQALLSTTGQPVSQWYVTQGKSITLTASANERYAFLHWQDATGEQLSSEAEYTFTPSGDTQLTMVFEKLSAQKVVAGGVTLGSENSPAYATTDAAGAVTLQPDYGEEDNWNLRFENSTLTMRNANITGVPGVNPQRPQDNAAVYAEGDLTVVLLGKNKATAADSLEEGDSIGFCLVDGNMVFQGGGSLEATGGQADHNFSAGIMNADGAVSVEDVTLILKGGKSEGNSVGIHANSVAVKNAAAQLYAAGGEGNYGSIGIGCETFLLENGAIEATGGEYAQEISAVQGDTLEIRGGKLRVQIGDRSTHGAVLGLTGNQLKISGGEVESQIGRVTHIASAGEELKGAVGGVHADEFSISGGRLSVQTGDFRIVGNSEGKLALMNTGIACDKQITISGGTLEIQAGNVLDDTGEEIAGLAFAANAMDQDVPLTVSPASAEKSISVLMGKNPSTAVPLEGSPFEAEKFIALPPSEVGAYLLSYEAGSVPVTVTQWPEASDIVYGQTLAESRLTGGAAESVNGAVAGSFAWADSTQKPDSIGSKTYQVIFTPDSSQYQSAVGTVTVQINPAQPVLSWTDNTQTVTYNGSPAAVAAPVVTLQNGETYTGTFRWQYKTQNGAYRDGLPAEAGSYQVKAAIDAQGNYGAAETQQDLALTIARRPVSVIAQAASKAYGQTDPAFTYTTSAVAGAADSGLVIGDSLTGVLSREPGEGVGSYDLTQGTLTDEQNPNYTIVFEGTDRFTIQKAAMGLTLTTTPSAQKVGSPVKITIAAKNMESNLMESGWIQPDGTVLLTGPDGKNIPLTKNEDGSWSGSYTIPNDTPVGGTLLFSASAADENYTDATATARVAVTDKGLVNLALTPDRTGVTYGNTVTYTFTAAKADPSDPDELTGTVQFYLDGTDEAHKAGAAQELSGEVKLTLDRTSLTAGSHTVYAVYSGNTGFSGAAVSTTTLVVPKALAWNTDGITTDKAYDGTVSAAAVAGMLNITGVLDGDDVSFAYTALTAPDFATAEPHTQDVTLSVAGGVLNGAQADNYQLPASGPVVTASINKVDQQPVEPPVEDDNDYKLEIEEGISNVPEELEKNPDLNTPAKIGRMLKTQITNLGVTEGNRAIYDVTLMVSEDGGKPGSPPQKKTSPPTAN